MCIRLQYVYRCSLEHGESIFRPCNSMNYSSSRTICELDPPHCFLDFASNNPYRYVCSKLVRKTIFPPKCERCAVRRKARKGKTGIIALDVMVTD
ncbi:hypothetical protein DM02DRAFT_614778 [Periconia macrospinosa]|uniref:Uncharacterized protein n=1 Tax=Periconia macrospinosa TaxID=97972 RepID=A0A2V1DNB0_9PLEO|nr:hypothetical protein DM02DRAFT_614778 [Periconia macrospinosa]